MKIIVIGGGINGLLVSKALAESGNSITLIEKGEILAETSSKTSKLIHGGLRYLENFQFSFVRESLRERQWWLDSYPKHVKPIKIYYPIFKQTRRSPLLVRLGLFIYDHLFLGSSIQKSKRENLKKFIRNNPDLKKTNLDAVFSYYDGFMDDCALGKVLIKEAKDAGVEFHEQTYIEKIKDTGEVTFSEKSIENETIYSKYDLIINATGPWAIDLLKRSNLKTNYNLDLIRGSHILVDKTIDHGYILEIPNSKRVFFVLPHNESMLIGTTEVKQEINEEVVISHDELKDLISAYNRYFHHEITEADILDSYSGLRPIVSSENDPTSASREFTFEINNKILNIFGGKWTTSRLLASKLGSIVESIKKNEQN